MARRVTVWQVLKNDYLCLILTLFCVVSWVLPVFPAVAGFVPRRGGRSATIAPADQLPLTLLFVGIAVVITALCGWLAYRRLSNIRRVVSAGQMVTGRVLGVWFQKDRGRIEYEYTFGGQTYQAGSTVMKNKDTEGLTAEAELALIVDPEKPSRALIASLYTS